MRTGRDSLLTLSVGAAGAVLFWLLGFPAAFLTGPAVAVTLAGLAGLRLVIPVPLRDLCFLTLGVGIGATVTPDVIRTAMTWPLSLAVLTLGLYLTMLIAQRLLVRGFGFDHITALLAAAPGHLSYVLGLSTELSANVPRVALVQSVRVLLLTLLVPVILVIWQVEGTAPLTQVGWLGGPAMAAIFGLAACVGLFLLRVRIPAPFLLGGMAVSAVGHGTALTPGALPPAMTVAAFVVMGSLIGTRFQGLGWSDIRASLWAGVGVTLIACLVAAGAAMVASALTGVAPAVLLLAFAPGGVEVMAAMAVDFALEPAFVAAHHVMRLMVLTLLIPILLRAERRRPARH